MGKEKRKEKKLSWVIKGLLILVAVIALVIIMVGCTNAVVVMTTQDKIVSAEEAQDLDAECILVLGAGVNPDGSPTWMLEDRLDVAIDLYKSGAAPKIIMSGDNATVTYNEVEAMKRYAIKQGVPTEDIFCDHAGFSTYESMYRAQAIFGVERMIVVTQSYHLYRALYAADGFGMEVKGVASDLGDYGGQAEYNAREVLARTKDFFMVLVKTPPTFLGDPISLDQSGDITEG